MKEIELMEIEEENTDDIIPLEKIVSQFNPKEIARNTQCA